jgi:hypothetical protein
VLLGLLQSEFVCNPQNMMCEERVAGLQSILRSLATRVPRIILHRAEELFPAMRESMVSVLCMYAQQRIVLSSSVKEILYDKLVLVLIITHCNSLVYCSRRVINPS